MKPPTPKEPPPAAKKPTKGITRKAFGELLKRAISPASVKTAPKTGP
jgi:hypothetical protein